MLMVNQLNGFGVGGDDWHTVFSATLSGDVNNVGYTSREVIPNAQLTDPTGTLWRFTFRSGDANGVTIDKAYVGSRAAAGDAYDVDSFTQILFGAAAYFSVAPATDKLSDEVAFTLTAGRDLVISFYSSSGRSSSQTISSVTDYYKLGDDAATANTSGYTGNNNYFQGVRLIETK